MAVSIGSLQSGSTYSVVGMDRLTALRAVHGADDGLLIRDRHLGVRAKDPALAAVEQPTVARLDAVLQHRKTAAATNRPHANAPKRDNLRRTNIER